ncbi:MAG: tetratricopeptide repeat protein [Syntrophobacteraceae bacterium]
MDAVPKTGARALIQRLLPVPFIIVIFAAYSNTFTSPPFLDDFHSFIYEKSIYLQDFSSSSLLSIYHTRFGKTRLIPMLTLALNHKLGESNLIYFHLVNIVIHIFAFLAVCFLTKQIISIEKKRDPDSVSSSVAGWLPICVAALWALNPVQTNAVTYLVQRMASIQALFYFLAVGCYLKARSCSPESWRKAAGWYAGVAAASIGAFLSKENSVLLPFMLVVTEIWFFDSKPIDRLWLFFRRRSWRIWVVLGLAAIAFGVLTYDLLWPLLLDGYAKRHFTMTERVLTEGRVVIWYISLLLWPDPGRLSMEHDVDLSTSLLSPMTTLPSLLFIALLIGGSIYWRKRHPIITFGIMWYFLNLALESTIWPLELVFEHRLYLPSFGVFLVLVMLMGMALRQAARTISETDYVKVLCSVVIMLVSCSAILTFLRNEDWQDTITINHDVATKAPGIARANVDYAIALLRVGEYEESMKYAEKSLSLSKPGLETYGLSANAIVTTLVQMGKFEEAIARGDELLANQPSYLDGDAHPTLYLSMAQACMVLDRFEDAYKHILQAFKYIEMTDKSIHKKEMASSVLGQVLEWCRSREVDINGDGASDPGNKPIDLWIALEVQKIGDLPFAAQLMEQAYAHDPDNIEITQAVQNLKREEALNDAQKEKGSFSKKYVLRPYSRFNICMAVAFLAQERRMPGPFLKIGEKCLDWALEIDPDSADALLLAGWYAYNGEKADQAVVLARKALARDPDNAKIWLGLSFFLAKAAHGDEALAALDKVIELYPGFSRRQVLEALRAEIMKGERISPISGNHNDSRMNTRTQHTPSS